MLNYIDAYLCWCYASIIFNLITFLIISVRGGFKCVWLINCLFLFRYKNCFDNICYGITVKKNTPIQLFNGSPPWKFLTFFNAFQGRNSNIITILPIILILGRSFDLEQWWKLSLEGRYEESMLISIPMWLRLCFSRTKSALVHH